MTVREGVAVATDGEIFQDASRLSSSPKARST